jgi:hypothetical protein
MRELQLQLLSNRKLLYDIKNPFDFNLISSERGRREEREGISINIDLQFNLIHTIAAASTMIQPLRILCFAFIGDE